MKNIFTDVKITTGKEVSTRPSIIVSLETLNKSH